MSTLTETIGKSSIELSNVGNNGNKAPESVHKEVSLIDKLQKEISELKSKVPVLKREIMEMYEKDNFAEAAKKQTEISVCLFEISEKTSQVEFEVLLPILNDFIETMIDKGIEVKNFLNLCIRLQYNEETGLFEKATKAPSNNVNSIGVKKVPSKKVVAVYNNGSVIEYEGNKEMVEKVLGVDYLTLNPSLQKSSLNPNRVKRLRDDFSCAGISQITHYYNNSEPTLLKLEKVVK